MGYNYFYGSSMPYVYNQNNEVVFSVDSKIVAANDQPKGGEIRVTFQTNENVIETDKYLL